STGEKPAATQSPTLSQLQHGLVKALYLVRKFNFHESMVDAFVWMLFHALGFTDKNWLYIAPQLKLYLNYSETAAEARADFAILDVASFFRVAVVEDKSEMNPKGGGEPQMIAELIAAMQANAPKRSVLKLSFTATAAAATSAGSSQPMAIEEE